MINILIQLIGILIALIIVVSYFLLFLYPLIGGAPYVPTDTEKVKKMLELSGIGPGKLEADLGSGDGRIVIAIAKTRAEAHGYEISPLLVLMSKAKIKSSGLKNAVIYKKSFWDADLSKYDVLFMYQLPYVMKKFERKFFDKLKTEAIIVSNGFTIDSWKQAKEDGSIHVYNVSENRPQN